MGDFFHGWRRKVGFSVMLCALAILSVWARSSRTAYVIRMHIGGETSFQQLDTMRTGVRWKRLSGVNRKWRILMDIAPGWSIRDPQSHYSDPCNVERRGTDWHCRGCGFDWKSGYDHLVSGVHFEVVVVPYWSIILPLTVLSWYLLLYKPPKLKPIVNNQVRAGSFLNCQD